MSLNEFLGDDSKSSHSVEPRTESAYPRYQALGSWADEMDALPTARECLVSVGNCYRLNTLVQPLQGPTGMVRGVIAAETISSHPVVSDDFIPAFCQQS